MQSYIFSVASMIIGAIGIIGMFRADVKVLATRMDALIQQNEIQQVADKQLFDLHLDKIATRVEDIARYMGVGRRKVDDVKEE